MKISKIHEGYIEIENKEKFHSIVCEIKTLIKNNKIKKGKIELHLLHEVGSIVPLGWENVLKEDMEDFLNDILPAGKYIKHDEPETPFRKNFFQHAQTKLIGSPFFILQINDGKIVLGKYQDVCIFSPIFSEIPKFKIFYRIYEFG
ncbi:MAG: YjbQ family protein, partial [Candidatus Aenigmatarchaeota archaeon]